ncbi:MAG: DNA repair protein RadA [Chitinophagales bacterium]|nr:DNA repair protein RadA [Chitinophagaceae bacterium]MBP9882526.1 DNA repair protein RadA [Chitinophagales bacterium]
MATIKTLYLCQNCGAQSSKWIGKCPSCGEWNTYVEEVIKKELKATPWRRKERGLKELRPQRLDEISNELNQRTITPDEELNRVLGGGLVAGSIILIGGEPGFGKSTLLLQLALRLRGKKVLYISGEESEQQIKLRAERLQQENADCFVLTETNTENIFFQIAALQPDVLIIDSIQTMQTPSIDASAGSVSQVRECTNEFLRYAKESGTPVFLIGHITKEGTLAGPKVLEHMVDTVLQLEGDRHYAYRILRTIKNRYGSASELGIYELTSAGMREVRNASELLITQREEAVSGIAIASMLEGIRPMLIETQALVTPSVYGTPQRTSTGFDLRRMNMLLAVLEKRCGFHFGVKDVFLNIAGGLRVEDPAIDLAVVAALLSSYEDVPIVNNYCFSGEVGLSGEVRAVNRIEQRIGEADKLGLQKIFVSKYNRKGLDLAKYTIEVVWVSKVDEMIHHLM